MQRSAGKLWILEFVWTLFTRTTHLNIAADRAHTHKVMIAPHSKDHHSQQDIMSQCDAKKKKPFQQWFEVLNKKPEA